MTEQIQSDKQEWLTAKQVAARYSVNINRVYNWSYKKRVATKHIDRDLYLSRASVEKLLKRLNRDNQVKTDKDFHLSFQTPSNAAGKVEKPVKTSDEVVKFMDLRPGRCFADWSVRRLLV